MAKDRLKLKKQIIKKYGSLKEACRYFRQMGYNLPVHQKGIQHISQPAFETLKEAFEKVKVEKKTITKKDQCAICDYYMKLPNKMGWCKKNGFTQGYVKHFCKPRESWRMTEKSRRLYNLVNQK